MTQCSASTRGTVRAGSLHTLRATTVHCRTDADAAVAATTCVAADLFPIQPFHLGPMKDPIAPMIPIAIVHVCEYSSCTERWQTPSASSSEVAGADVLLQAMSHLLAFYPRLSDRLVLLPSGGVGGGVGQGSAAVPLAFRIPPRCAMRADGKGWVSAFEALDAFLWQGVYQLG